MYKKFLRTYGVLAGISSLILTICSQLQAHGPWFHVISDYNDKVAQTARVLLVNDMHKKKWMVRTNVLSMASKFSGHFRCTGEYEQTRAEVEQKCNLCQKTWRGVANVGRYKRAGEWTILRQTVYKSDVTEEEIGEVESLYGAWKVGRERERFEIAVERVAAVRGEDVHCQMAEVRTGKAMLVFDETLSRNLIEQLPEPIHMLTGAIPLKQHVDGQESDWDRVFCLDRNEPGTLDTWKQKFPALIRMAQMRDAHLADFGSNPSPEDSEERQ